MKVLVFSNIYPSKDAKTLGVFVKNFIKELDEIGIDYRKVVINMRSGKVGKIFSYISYFTRLLFFGLFSRHDIIYVHYASHNAWAVNFIKIFRRKTKVITNCHGSDVLPQTFIQEKSQSQVKKLLKRSYKVVVPSKYFKNVIYKRYNIDERKIYIYPSAGINKDIFYKKEVDPSFLKKYGIDENKSYIGYVSRIAKDKGWDTFLYAYKKIICRNDNLNISAIMVGLGEEKEDFFNLVEKLELKDDLIYIESLSQEDLNNLYNLIDVFIFPTRREGESLGLVGIEAMATGTPVIGSDYAALKYIIKDGYNGFKFPFNDYEGLYDKVIEYFSLSNEERENLSLNAYKTGEEFFTERLRGNLEKIILE